MGTLIPDAERVGTVELAQHQQTAWENQSKYVADKSVFYQDLWAGQSVPADLRDLPELPLSDKAQLRISQSALKPFGTYLAAPRSAVARLHRTSGTSGQAMNLAMSMRDCNVDRVGRGCDARVLPGLNSSHTVVHCLNYKMWMGGLTDHLTLERTGATVVPFGVGDTELLIRTIRGHWHYRHFLHTILPRCPGTRAERNNSPTCSPARSWPETWPVWQVRPGLDDPALRERIREVWGMEPRNANYGVSDVFCNFAAQCEHDTRLHFIGC